MAWQATPYTALLIVAAVVSAASALFVWWRHSVPGSKTVTLISVSSAISMVGYALELGCPDAAAKDFWNKVQHLGIVFVPTISLIFILRYTGREKWLISRNLILLGVEPVAVLLLILSNEAHGLMWERPLPEMVDPSSVLVRPHGTAHQLNAAYSYALLLTCIFLLAEMLIRSHQLYRRQASVLLLAASLPAVGGAIMQFATNLPSHVDLTPITMTISSMIMSWDLPYMRLKDMVPAARGVVIENMSDGVIVLDAQDRIVNLNLAAERLVGQTILEAIGKPVRQVWPEWPIQGRGPNVEPDTIEVTEEIVVDADNERHIYDVHISPLLDWRDHLVGRVAVLHDITELKRRTMELSTLLETTRATSSTLELEEVLSLIAEQLVQTTGVDGCTLSRWDHAADAVVTWIDWRHPNTGTVDEPGAVYALSDFPATRAVLETRQPCVVHVSDPSADPAEVTYLREVNSACLLMLPLVASDRVVGLIELDQSRYERCFTPQEIRLCQALADQAAITIENARLYEEAQRRARELAFLNQTGQAIASTLDMDMVMDRAMNEAISMVDAEAAATILYDSERQDLVFATVVGPAASTLVGMRMPISMGIVGWCVREGQPALVHEAQDDPRFYDQIDAMTGMTTRSLLAVPLRYKGKVIGAVEAVNKINGRFDQHDLDLLTTLAGSAAVAIENARLYGETARRLAETQVLQEVMLVAASSLDFDLVLERTMETLQTRLQVEFFGCVLPKEDEEGRISSLRLHRAQIGSPKLPEDTEIPLDRSVCGQVLLSGEPLLIGDVREIPYYHQVSPEVRSELAVPVRVSGEVIAVLNVESRHLNGFDRGDLDFYTAIAGQLGVALQNAQLYQEVRRQADELMSAVARLQELDRLKSEFIQNVSHELRTPLALIRGYAEILDMGELGELQPEQQQPVTVIARRSRMLSSLVEDISSILEAEQNPPQPEPVALDELTHAALEDFEIAARRAGLTLCAEIAPDLPWVHGSPIYLRQVLDNLLQNAVKFTPPGGTITVRLRHEHKRKAKGGWVALEVSDTGIGIPREEYERIFDRFYQVDGSVTRRYGGVGLGLALVKEIIEAYDGQVIVQSRVGEGTTFTVMLPTTA